MPLPIRLNGKARKHPRTVNLNFHVTRQDSWATATCRARHLNRGARDAHMGRMPRRKLAGRAPERATRGVRGQVLQKAARTLLRAHNYFRKRGAADATARAGTQVRRDAREARSPRPPSLGNIRASATLETIPNPSPPPPSSAQQVPLLGAEHVREKVSPTAYSAINMLFRLHGVLAEDIVSHGITFIADATLRIASTLRHAPHTSLPKSSHNNRTASLANTPKLRVWRVSAQLNNGLRCFVNDWMRVATATPRTRELTMWSGAGACLSSPFGSSLSPSKRPSVVNDAVKLHPCEP